MPQQPQQLDQDAVNLAKAIRQKESGGNFTAKGGSGEHGGYQFMPEMWSAYSKEAGVNAPLEQATPEQQNQVAYTKIKKWKDQGYNPGQIASMWNAGEGKPNAYLEGHKGVNAKGIAYDTPKYATDVASIYQQLKGTQPQQQVAGANIAQAAGTTPQEPDNRNLLQKGLDFAFPVVSDISNIIQGKNTKSPLQITGDAALSALWFVPGLGATAGGALKAAPLLGRILGEGGAQLAGHAVAGAATGYGADVASKLSGGETDAGKIFKPGLGTVAGGVVGAGAGKLGQLLGKNTTQTGAVRALTDNIAENLNATKTGRVFMDAARSTGHNPAELIARSGAIPDVVDSKFSTGAQQQFLGKRIAGLGEARAEALDSMGTVIKIKDLQKAALEATKDPSIIASGESAKIQKAIKRLFDDFKANYGDSISVSDLEKIKEAQAKASNIYRKTGQIGEQNASSLIGNVARSKIEEIADKSGLQGMKEYNNYIKAHYTAIEALKKLNGQAVKGGRLGNMLRGHAAAAAASVAGGSMGGPLGAAGGFLAAEGANKILSKILGDTALSNPLRDAILRRIEQANPGIVEQMLQFTGNQGKKVAPLLTPKGGQRTGLLPQLLGQTAARGAAQVNQ